MLRTNWKKNIILVGFMGAGKSTVASVLAKKLRLQLQDTDQIIVQRLGRSIPDVFEEMGEEVFRDEETLVLSDLSRVRNHVIATGGGIVMKKDNWTLMHEIGPVVFLQLTVDLLKTRLMGETGRPLADGFNWEDTLQRYRSRLPMYRQADISIDAENKSPEMIADEILIKLEQKNISWKF